MEYRVFWKKKEILLECEKKKWKERQARLFVFLYTPFKRKKREGRGL